MANINLYSTLAEYKAFTTARGQTASTDTTDDAVIKDLLETASRYLDGRAMRQFYPTIETRYYDVPRDSGLWLDGDLLEIITLTNGDATTISSTNYKLHDPNFSPYYAITLKGSSNIQWEADSSGNSDQVISLLAYWGYYEKFSQRAWSIGGTLGAAMTDTTTLAFTMTAGHSLAVGQLVKIGNELLNIDTVSTNTITPIARGDNGSTAATHLNGVTVYVFEPDARVRNAVLEQAVIDYAQRFGKSVSNTATVTAAGVVIAPNGIAKSMNDLIALTSPT